MNFNFRGLVNLLREGRHKNKKSFDTRSLQRPSELQYRLQLCVQILLIFFDTRNLQLSSELPQFFRVYGRDYV